MKIEIKKKPVNISRLIPLAFLGIILLGTVLLMLPAASRDGQSCPLMTALFTATSSTCVTGLILADTWTQWSMFGQVVLLVLIEIGGLGFMSLASSVIFLFRKKLDMTSRMAIAQSIGGGGSGDMARVQKTLLQGCLSAEGVGALILTVHFMKDYDFGQALWMGVFHSVSAFCNAGFDVMGFKDPDGSLMSFSQDPVVLLTLAALIITGGIGFLVWDEMMREPRKKWSVYTRLVLITSGALLLSGTVLILLTEWNNPDTLGKYDFWGKLLGAFFQSVTTRTAGFDALGQGAMTEAGKGVSIFYMLIGGSAGSTAGGLKTVTFVTLVLFLWSRFRGEDQVCVFKRNIPMKHVLDAVTIFSFMVIMAFFGAVLINATATETISFTDALYETVSALATVGLTTGITRHVGPAGQLLLILYMYFGRVGVLTISMGFLKRTPQSQQFRYASTSLLIG